MRHFKKTVVSRHEVLLSIIENLKDELSSTKDDDITIINGELIIKVKVSSSLKRDNNIPQVFLDAFDNE